MRFVAFTLFVCAAFDWTLPWLDRMGTAALALGCVALTIGTVRAPRARRFPFPLPNPATAATSMPPGSMDSLGDKIAAYTMDDPTGVGVPRPDLT